MEWRRSGLVQKRSGGDPQESNLLNSLGALLSYYISPTEQVHQAKVFCGPKEAYPGGMVLGLVNQLGTEQGDN
jgi:hypothetical protein